MMPLKLFFSITSFKPSVLRDATRAAMADVASPVIAIALVPVLDTVFLTPDARYQFISSTLVREISALQGDVAQFVAPSVLARLQARRQGS